MKDIQKKAIWYKNIPEDEKQKIGEYRKKYYKMRKSALS